MGTTSNSLGSSSATSAASPSTIATPLYFTGLSSFSSDFQSIIQRAVQIADIPVQNLQNQEATNSSQLNALNAIDPGVTAVGADVIALGALANSQALAASSSDSSTVSVVNTGATAPATYTISNITSLASAASETSLQGYSTTAPVTALAGDLVNLVVGSNTFQLNLSATGQNNVAGLAAAINNANAGVSATVLTAGSLNYLSISASSTGINPIQLNSVMPADLISATGTGTETSLITYPDSDSTAVSSSGQVQLVVGTNDYALNVSASTSNNLTGLAQAINSAGAGVTATVTDTAGAYSLSVVASSGSPTIQLNDLQTAITPKDLVSATGTGTETSLTTYATANASGVSGSGQVQLVVGSNDYALDVSASASNNLNGLVRAINSAGAGVTATVTGSAGAYSLSMVATSGSPTTIQLNDLLSSNDLVSSTNRGSNTSFTLTGVPNPIVESTNNITDVIPGVSFTLQNTMPSGSVTLSLASDPTQLGSALQTFVTDYNTLVTQVQAQEGQAAGPLQGDLIINQISSDMQQLVSYYSPSATSSVRSLSDLGITFNDTGQMSFSSSTFNSLSDTQISDAFKFLGSSSNGFAALASNFTQLTDPVSGLIQTQILGYEAENTQLAAETTTAQARATAIQQSATAQAEAADALTAELQSEQTSLDASIQSVNYVLYGSKSSSY
jgi:flagellar hook-associated protein 2